MSIHCPTALFKYQNLAKKWNFKNLKFINEVRFMGFNCHRYWEKVKIAQNRKGCSKI
jgi:hypothetical protein